MQWKKEHILIKNVLLIRLLCENILLYDFFFKFTETSDVEDDNEKYASDIYNTAMYIGGSISIGKI